MQTLSSKTPPPTPSPGALLRRRRRSQWEGNPRPRMDLGWCFALSCCQRAHATKHISTGHLILECLALPPFGETAERLKAFSFFVVSIVTRGLRTLIRYAPVPQKPQPSPSTSVSIRLPSSPRAPRMESTSLDHFQKNTTKENKS